MHTHVTRTHMQNGEVRKMCEAKFSRQEPSLDGGDLDELKLSGQDLLVRLGVKRTANDSSDDLGSSAYVRFDDDKRYRKSMNGSNAFHTITGNPFRAMRECLSKLSKECLK